MKYLNIFYVQRIFIFLLEWYISLFVNGSQKIGTKLRITTYFVVHNENKHTAFLLTKKEKWHSLTNDVTSFPWYWAWSQDKGGQRICLHTLHGDIKNEISWLIFNANYRILKDNALRNILKKIWYCCKSIRKIIAYWMSYEKILHFINQLKTSHSKRTVKIFIAMMRLQICLYQWS